MTDWTAERIAALPTAQIKILRENAVRCVNDAVAALCDAAIAKRGPSRDRSLRVKIASASRTDEVVVGFHFVCPQGKGVTSNGDGTVWTGTWVVDKVHAELGSKRGAYVALHLTKSEPSYLQVIITGLAQNTP
jgi:hypothetical protein